MRRLRRRTHGGAALRLTQRRDPGGPHGHPNTRAPTPPDRQPGTGAHSRRRPSKDTQTPRRTDTGRRRRAPPGGPRTRARAPRYLHVVDDRLEEPAQGAALLLRRLHARAGRRGAGGARAAGGEPGRGGRSLRARPGLPPRGALSGRQRRARGSRAAAGRRRPWRAGLAAAGGRGAGSWRRSLGAGTEAAVTGAAAARASRGRGEGDAGGREGGRGSRREGLWEPPGGRRPVRRQAPRL